MPLIAEQKRERTIDHRAARQIAARREDGRFPEAGRSFRMIGRFRFWLSDKKSRQRCAKRPNDVPFDVLKIDRIVQTLPPELVKLGLEGGIALVALNDPSKRNALGLAMFEALEQAIGRIGDDESIHVVLLHGEGAAFCAGFDLHAVVHDAKLMSQFIQRLSVLNQTLRQMRQVVVASVQGAAIAGGCALLSACDFVFVADDAKLGYPVHRIGISPAVTIPMLQQAIGSGAARSLLMGGELISGAQALRLALATHLSQSGESVFDDALAFCKALLEKGRHALAATKAWLNELDGSMDDSRFERPVKASSKISESSEARAMLAQWHSKLSG